MLLFTLQGYKKEKLYIATQGKIRVYILYTVFHKKRAGT